MPELVEIEVKGLRKVQEKIGKSQATLNDFRTLFSLISADFYKDQKRLFQLKSPGQFPDLASSTKLSKQREFGKIYPILFATGRLANSLLSPSGSDAVNVIKKKSMVIGTSVPYAVFHHSEKPRSKIPRRPLFDEDEGSPTFKRWLRITDVWLEKAIQGAFD